MAAIEELVGKTVKNHKGEDVPVASFTGAGTVVGLYFSAHWCPPCRGFTPQLAEFYTKINTSKKQLEIIFVSSDREEKTHGEYFSEMPWLALKYSLRDLKDALSKKYGVRGIPTLVFLDGESGEIINGEGRTDVCKDPEGVNFPWKK